MNYYFEDFTEDEYRRMVRLAMSKWEMVSFADREKSGRICLWRHDIDLSPHRARRIAEIESEEGVRATYYVLPHSQFYNVLEREVRDLVRSIAAAGHHIGLHFDPGFYDSDELAGTGIVEKLAAERALLQSVVGADVTTFSYHNSDLIPAAFKSDADEIAGMANAAGAHIRRNFGYCSDSNGYWRFSRLRDVLESGAHERLHVLTHPDWWVPQPMPPRDRVSRCIDGRAKRQHEWYDALLAGLNRTNVK